MPQLPKRLLSVLALTMLMTTSIKAQSTTQTAREEIVDQESTTALPEADAVVVESHPTLENEKTVTSSRTFTLEETRRYDGLFDGGNRMVPGYSLMEMTRGSDPELKKDRLKVASSLHHKFNLQYPFRAGGLNNVPPTFQRDLFTKTISLKSAAFRRAMIAPLLLTAAGLSTFDDDNDDNYEIRAERNRHIPNFRHHADDYLQHSPVVVVYGLNWLGVKGKNDFANRTAILVKSELIMGALTFSLKRITAVRRPDDTERTSFPSGHTAQAFAGAAFLAKEYGHKSIWYSIGAYTVATGVGAMRVMNNRHWLSDVVVGAGIGILSTNLAYLTHQYRWGKKKKVAQTTVLPSYDGQTGMVSIIHRID